MTLSLEQCFFEVFESRQPQLNGAPGLRGLQSPFEVPNSEQNQKSPEVHKTRRVFVLCVS